MKLQVLQDGHGKNTGIFIPIEDWKLIKSKYPDIENTDDYLPEWEQELIDKRLEAIAEKPERLKQGENLLKELNRKI